jgi:hypothetical protein
MKAEGEAILESKSMDSEPGTNHEPPIAEPAPDQPAGYQPSIGRKLFMLALCILGLIMVWTFYFAESSKH